MAIQVSFPMTIAAGADVTKGRWVVVVLEDGCFKRALVEKTIADVLDAVGGFSVLAVDIPIGLPGGRGHRRCDVEAKALLKAKASSVFFAPPHRVILEPIYERANLLSKTEYRRGISRQAYGLRAKILEVAPFASQDDRIIEAHPEVCFHTMKGAPLEYSKKTWNGQMERRSLLEAQGIKIRTSLKPLDQFLQMISSMLPRPRGRRGGYIVTGLTCSPHPSERVAEISGR